MKNTFVVLIIVLSVALLAIIFVPSISPMKFLTVTGNSMEPVISEDDVLVVLPADCSQLKKGDIIVYKHEVEEKKFTFTHRIVAIEHEEGGNTKIITKGDNLPEPDDYFVKPSQVIGTVSLVIPFLGAFLRFVNSFYGLFLLIIIPAILIIFMEVRKIIRYRGIK